MKPWITPLTGFIAGAALALLVAEIFWVTFCAAIPSALQSLDDKQRYSCLISLAVLDKLEKGDQGYAKRILVREVASYYQHPFGPPDSPQRKKILPYIEDVRARSTALNEELSKNAQ
jgi:hypothetical protein